MNIATPVTSAPKSHAVGKRPRENDEIEVDIRKLQLEVLNAEKEKIQLETKKIKLEIEKLEFEKSMRTQRESNTLHYSSFNFPGHTNDNMDRCSTSNSAGFSGYTFDYQ